MELTPENKAHIDSLSLSQLLFKIRFGASGDPWLHDNTGSYWMKRYAEKREEDPAGAVQASKEIGWGAP